VAAVNSRNKGILPLLLWCPGFIWDRVHFLSCSWCSAVFRIWDENKADNIPMFLAVSRQPRTFQLLMLAWDGRCAGAGRGHSQDS